MSRDNKHQPHEQQTPSVSCVSCAVCRGTYIQQLHAKIAEDRKVVLDHHHLQLGVVVSGRKDIVDLVG
jgi:hypothetical protein